MASINLYTDNQIKFLKDIITLLDKRKRNLEKRKENLNEDQKLALCKADEVCASVELIDELSKLIGKIVDDAMKEAENFVKNIQTILRDNHLSLLTKSLELLEIFNVFDCYTNDSQIQDEEFKEYFKFFKRYLCKSSNSAKCFKTLSQNLLNINEKNFDKLLPLNPKVYQDMKPNRIKELIENIDSLDTVKLRKIRDQQNLVEINDVELSDKQQQNLQIKQQKSKEEKSFNFLHSSVVPNDQLQNHQRNGNKNNSRRSCGEDFESANGDANKKKTSSFKFPIPLMELSPTTTLSVENSQVLAECSNNENKDKASNGDLSETWNAQKLRPTSSSNNQTNRLNNAKLNGISTSKEASKSDAFISERPIGNENFSNFSCESIKGFTDAPNGNEPSKLFDLLMKFNNGSSNNAKQHNIQQQGQWQNGQSKLTPGINVVGMKVNGEKKSMNITKSNCKTYQSDDQSSEKDLQSIPTSNNNQYHQTNNYFYHAQPPVTSLMEPPTSWHSSNPIRPPAATAGQINSSIFNNNSEISSVDTNIQTMSISSAKASTGYPPNIFSSLHDDLSKNKYHHPFQSYPGHLKNNNQNNSKLISTSPSASNANPISQNHGTGKSLTLDDLINSGATNGVNPVSNANQSGTTQSSTNSISSAFLNNLSLKQNAIHRLNAANNQKNGTPMTNNGSTEAKKLSDGSSIKDIYSSYNKFFIEKSSFSMDPNEAMDELEKINITNIYDVN